MIIGFSFTESCRNVTKTSLETLVSEFKESYYQELLQKGDTEEIEYYEWILSRGICITLVMYEWEDVPHVSIWSSHKPFILSGSPVWRTRNGLDSLFFHQVSEFGIESAKKDLFKVLQLDFIEKNNYPAINGEPYSMDYVFLNNKWILVGKGWNAGHWYEAMRRSEERKYAIRFDSLMNMYNENCQKTQRNKLVFRLIQDDRDLFIGMIDRHKTICDTIITDLQNPTCDKIVIEDCIRKIDHHYGSDSVKKLVMDALIKGLKKLQ